MSRIAVVGAGIAGIACARNARSTGHDVTVLERSHVPGGRMASRALHGRRVDLGASYLTVSDHRFEAIVDDWVAHGLARPWTRSFASWEGGILTTGDQRADQTGPMRFAAPGGLRSLVEDLARDVPVCSGTPVTEVGPGPVVDGTAYDAVVLAMPDPQALHLLAPGLVAARDLLTGREWQPALALVAGFDRRTWEPEGVFVNNHPVLSWVADDGRRRGDDAPVLVAHSTPGFATPRLSEPGAAVDDLLAALQEVLGVGQPGWTYLQRWTWAKPVGTRDAAYGLAGPIGLCGDGWGASKVEAAWLSGHLLGEALASG